MAEHKAGILVPKDKFKAGERYYGGIVNWRTRIVHLAGRLAGLLVKVEGFPLGTSRNIIKTEAFKAGSSSKENEGTCQKDSGTALSHARPAIGETFVRAPSDTKIGSFLYVSSQVKSSDYPLVADAIPLALNTESGKDAILSLNAEHFVITPVGRHRDSLLRIERLESDNCVAEKTNSILNQTIEDLNKASSEQVADLTEQRESLLSDLETKTKEINSLSAELAKAEVLGTLEIMIVNAGQYLQPKCMNDVVYLNQDTVNPFTKNKMVTRLKRTEQDVKVYLSSSIRKGAGFILIPFVDEDGQAAYKASTVPSSSATFTIGSK